MRTLSFLIVVVAFASTVAACGSNSARRDPNAPVANHDPESRRSLR